jgi:hypothetical protein
MCVCLKNDRMLLLRCKLQCRRKLRNMKGSSHSGDHTSKQEKALAKPSKQSKKFKSQSLGLSINEKTSAAKVVIRPIADIKINRGNLSSVSSTGDSVVCASARAIDLYASSTSDEESVAPQPH